MRALVMATLTVAAIAGSACGDCSCSPYGNFASVMLTDEDASQAVPVGMFQTVGVLLAGAGRTITASDTGRLVAYPVQRQPAGLTLELFRPDAPGQVGTPFEFGGTVTISAPASGDHPEWSATLIIGSDPCGDASCGAFAGSGAFGGGGTTVMALGQSFVVSWKAGGAPPASSNPSVLAPLGAPMLVHSGFQRGAETSVTVGPNFLQQLYVGAGPGTATLTLSDAVQTLTAGTRLYGGRQTFVVRPLAGFTCSPERGCIQGAGSPDRPDRWYAPNQTPPG